MLLSHDAQGETPVHRPNFEVFDRILLTSQALFEIFRCTAGLNFMSFLHFLWNISTIFLLYVCAHLRKIINYYYYCEHK